MYTRYTDEQTKRAGEVDLVTLLQQHGQQVRRVGSEYEWYDSDQTVSIKGNLWFGRLQYDVGVGAHSYRPVSIPAKTDIYRTEPYPTEFHIFTIVRIVGQYEGSV